MVGLLAAEPAETRERGVAEEHEESASGIACAAAPVRGPGGPAVAASRSPVVYPAAPCATGLAVCIAALALSGC